MVLGYYPVLTWLTYLLAGLAIGRSDLRSVAYGRPARGDRRGRGDAALVRVGADHGWRHGGPPAACGGQQARGTGWWVLMSTEGYGTTPARAWGWLTMAAPHTGTPFDLIGTTGSAMAVLGLCLLAVRVDWVRVLSHPVAAAGSMTLTLYTAHVVVLATDLGEWNSVTYYLAHVVVALTFASVWLWWLPKGPMEWMVHTISTGVGRMLIPPVVPPPPSPPS